MKIVHTINYFQPQLGYQEYFIAKEHVKMGHEVHVITSNRYFPFPDYDKTAQPILGERIMTPGQENYEGFVIHRLPVAYENGAVVKLKGIERLLETISPDYVLHHGISGNQLIHSVVRMQRKLGFILVCDDHMLFCAEKNRNILSVIKDYISYSFLYYFYWRKSITVFVGVADECTKYLHKRILIPTKHLMTIALGADTERFKFDKQIRGRTRKELEVQDDEVLIVYTGKIIEEKDPVLILDACLGNAESLRLRFLFVGNVSDSYKKRFGDTIDIMRKYVIHIPSQRNEDLSKYYCAADIGVWPKQASASMIEAASCSLPIIACNYLNERFANDNGIGIEEGNVEQLRLAIEKLASNKQLRHEMGLRSRELVESSMSWQAVAVKFLSIMDK